MFLQSSRSVPSFPVPLAKALTETEALAFLNKNWNIVMHYNNQFKRQQLCHCQLYYFMK